MRAGAAQGRTRQRKGLRRNMVKSVAVIGRGKLGAPIAACFAARGFRVEAVDLNSTKVEAINRGVAPVHEPGLQELMRSEEHTSELQSRLHLVCRLLLEKKKKTADNTLHEINTISTSVAQTDVCNNHIR